MKAKAAGEFAIVRWKITDVKEKVREIAKNFYLDIILRFPTGDKRYASTKKKLTPAAINSSILLSHTFIQFFFLFQVFLEYWCKFS